MNYENLLELLEIDTPADFTFFEQYAELAECEQEIPQSVLEQLFTEIDAETLAELTDAYFEDMLKPVADDVEFYTLFSMIGRELVGLAAMANKESALRYAEEFSRFKSWYLADAEVSVTAENTDDDCAVSVLHALALARAGELGAGSYRYDFSGALDYKIDEYGIPLGALSDENYDDDGDEHDDFENEHDHCHEHEHYDYAGDHDEVDDDEHDHYNGEHYDDGGDHDHYHEQNEEK